MSGKGSTPRPLSVSLDEYGEKHDRIFGRRCLWHGEITFPAPEGVSDAPGRILRRIYLRTIGPGAR